MSHFVSEIEQQQSSMPVNELCGHLAGSRGFASMIPWCDCKRGKDLEEGSKGGQPLTQAALTQGPGKLVARPCLKYEVMGYWQRLQWCDILLQRGHCTNSGLFKYELKQVREKGTHIHNADLVNWCLDSLLFYLHCLCLGHPRTAH